MKIMEPKRKAEDLVKKYSRYVYPYMGSGMLSNTIDGSVILYNAKECALIATQEALITIQGAQLGILEKFWNEVRTEISKMTELPKE